MKNVNLNQGLQGVMALATNVYWPDVDGDLLQKFVIDNPVEAGRQFTLFLMNQAKVNIQKLERLALESEFDVSEFSGLDEGDEYTPFVLDLRSDSVSEIDLREIVFKEPRIRHDGMIPDLWVENRKSSQIFDRKYVHCGSKVFAAIWKNRHRLPESWKGDPTIKENLLIAFEGTAFGFDSCDYMLAIFWDKAAQRWDYNFVQVHHEWAEMPDFPTVSAAIPVHRLKK